MTKILNSELILNEDGSIYHLNLLPEDIADTIIVVGDPDRVPKVSKYFEEITVQKQKREFVTHTGFYKGKRLSVISSGIGTDNVEILMTELDVLCNIDFKQREVKKELKKLSIIRIGTSGSFQKAIDIDSFLVSEYAVGLDNLMSFYDLPQGSIESVISEKIKETFQFDLLPYCVKGSEYLMNKIAFDMHNGVTLTSPGFYAPQGRKLRLPIKYPSFIDLLQSIDTKENQLTNFEMETAGYYAFGRLMGHEMLSINAIIANRALGKFSNTPKETVENLIQLVLDRIVAV